MGAYNMASLGQVEKRLEIIKIAIAITDRETIDLQRLKLRRHRDNKQLAAILEVIDDENYAQASQLIERYLGNSSYSQEKKIKKEITKEALVRAARDIEEEELIKKFGLFREPGRRESGVPLCGDNEENSIVTQKSVEIEFVDGESDLIAIEQQSETAQTKHLTTEDIIAQYKTIPTDNIPEKVTIPTTAKADTAKEDTKQIDNEKVPEEIEIDVEEFEIDEFEIEQAPYIEIDSGREDIQNDIKNFDEKFNRELEKQFKQADIEEKVDDVSDISNDETIERVEEVDSADDKEPKAVESVYEEDDIEYEAISYIDQKVRNMLNQYPQVVENVECFDSEEKLLHKISLDGYSERDIRETIELIYDLADEGKLDEASHLLLIVASTESIYAHFILARELYRGRILQKNISEAFTQMNQLAQDQYPEAICDLAQFYEYGIGTSKNRKKAFRLYEDAYDLGVDRADRHLTKMEEESRGILAKLFNKNK